MKDNEYHLDQFKVLDMCLTIWGTAHPVNIIHHNDRVRAFGILMTLPKNRDHYERLANGPKGRNQIDDISYHTKQIYQDTALGFNNKSIRVDLPCDAYNLLNIDDIDPNDSCRIRITRDWLWVKHVWETINISYKAALKEWFKGTGGGPGINAAFQTWADDKMEKYDINLDTCDHTDVASRPIILFHNYTKNKIPFLTVIRMWDKVADYILSSKHDPLVIGTGEIGFDDDHYVLTSDISGNEKIVCSVKKPPSPKKRKTASSSDKFDDLSTMVSSVMTTCKEPVNPVSPTPPPTKKLAASPTSIEDMPLDDLFKLLTQHCQHLEFLQKYDLDDDNKKRYCCQV